MKTINSSIPKDNTKNYDYVVIGAGSAGAIVAARLSEDPHTEVLLSKPGLRTTATGQRFHLDLRKSFSTSLIPQLCVHGVDTLRVIDASVMPTTTSGNINAAVLMIGEKGADLVKEYK